jgi:hypothetical protein
MQIFSIHEQQAMKLNLRYKTSREMISPEKSIQVLKWTLKKQDVHTLPFTDLEQISIQVVQSFLKSGNPLNCCINVILMRITPYQHNRDNKMDYKYFLFLSYFPTLTSFEPSFVTNTAQSQKTEQSKDCQNFFCTSLNIQHITKSFK